MIPYSSFFPEQISQRIGIAYPCQRETFSGMLWTKSYSRFREIGHWEKRSEALRPGTVSSLNTYRVQEIPAYNPLEKVRSLYVLLFRLQGEHRKFTHRLC